MQTVDVLPADRIQPWHDVHDEDKLAELVDSMTTAGWVGAPVVVITFDDRDPIAVTGSHRIAAARVAGIGVPVVDLDTLLAEHGTSLATLDEECGTLDYDELHYEAVVRLDSYLPADVVDYYGLDAH